MEAILALEDGTWFRGAAAGAAGEARGEVVFNTSMTGYQEVLTDPSYSGQIVTMTCPEIGNYGVSTEDVESRAPHVAGFIIRDESPVASNWRSEMTLREYLVANKIVAISDVDTRALTRQLRSGGVMRGVIATGSALDVKTLVEMLNEIDEESRALLVAYLDRRDAGWSEHAQGDAATGRPAASSGKMSEQEAYQILGLEAGASADDIGHAHRTLMKKFHPDQGGSTYLAARINEAKEILLRSHR